MPKGLSVLIIDDDPVFTEALSGTLTQAGHCVTHGNSASEAQTLLAKGRFDVAVVDLNLGGDNGIELIRQMRIKQRRLQILATTGVESDLYLEIAGYVGGQVCVRKFPPMLDGSFPAEEWNRAIADLVSDGQTR